MKTYEITIKPLSGFGTPLKGDTLFGHICWQTAYDSKLFNYSLDELLADYDKYPFLIISSAYPKYYENNKPVFAFKRPDMPLEYFFDINKENKKEFIENRKTNKAKKWMIIKETDKIESFKTLNYIDEKELFKKFINHLSINLKKQSLKYVSKSYIQNFSQSHNKINRLKGTTGEKGFAPFTSDQKVYFPQTELSIFVVLDKRLVIEQVKEALNRIGEFGFGKDASTGLGKFKVISFSEIDLKRFGSSNPNACYTLAPCVPEKNLFYQKYFSPFVRFGKHGDILAKSSNPFKNPVIAADEGAIFLTNNLQVFEKPFIGTAVKNISKAEPNSVMQGYSLYIPVKVEA